MKNIAFFDFDGTITTKDTLLEFIKFAKGKRAFYIGMLLYNPWLVAFKLGLISNALAKEKILMHFFANMPTQQFSEHCKAFASQQIPELIRSKAMQEIILLKERGWEIVVVTASAENWVQHWCADWQLRCIGTRLCYEGERISGKIEGKNCHGEEKVNRIRNEYSLSAYHRIYCYGDTAGDLPMLALAHVQFFQPFS